MQVQQQLLPYCLQPSVRVFALKDMLRAKCGRCRGERTVDARQLLARGGSIPIPRTAPCGQRYLCLWQSHIHLKTLPDS